MIARVYDTADRSTPAHAVALERSLQRNDHYGGSGYSQCADNAVTRWREDVTRDNWGTFIYLRDVRSGDVWSGGSPTDPKARDRLSRRILGRQGRFSARRFRVLAHAWRLCIAERQTLRIRRVSLTNHISTRTR
jgi:cyclic beta-1,2-glucan synthetase